MTAAIIHCALSIRDSIYAGVKRIEDSALHNAQIENARGLM